MDGCVIYPLWSHFLFSKSCLFSPKYLMCGFGLFEFVRVLFWVFFQSIINAGYIFCWWNFRIKKRWRKLLFLLKKKQSLKSVKKHFYQIEFIICNEAIVFFIWIDQVVMSWCCFLQLSFNYYHWKKRSSQHNIPCRI